jgi:Flp pilus assembly protein TadD
METLERDLKLWSAHLLLRRAVQNAQHGRWTEADRLVARSVALSADVAEAQFIRGKIYFWQGNFVAAESAFHEAVRLGLPQDRCAACLAALADEQLRRKAREMFNQDMKRAWARLVTDSVRLGRGVVRECTWLRGAQVSLLFIVIVLLWLGRQS